MEEDKLVILKTYMYPTEAYPLMSKLESEGIQCFLDGENTVSVYPFISNAIGGIKLKIRESDVPQAMEIIYESEADFLPSQDKLDEEKEVPRGFVKVKTHCQECESTNIYRKKFAWYKAVLAAILAVLNLPWAFLTKKHYCNDCGYSWNQ